MKFTGILLLLVACAARRDAVELRKEGQQHSNFALMGSEIRVYTGTEMDPTRLLGARIGIDGQIARQDVQSPRASAPQTEVGNTDEVALPR